MMLLFATIATRIMSANIISVSNHMVLTCSAVVMPPSATVAARMYASTVFVACSVAACTFMHVAPYLHGACHRCVCIVC